MNKNLLKLSISIICFMVLIFFANINLYAIDEANYIDSEYSLVEYENITEEVIEQMDINAIKNQQIMKYDCITGETTEVDMEELLKLDVMETEGASFSTPYLEKAQSYRQNLKLVSNLD